MEAQAPLGAGLAPVDGGMRPRIAAQLAGGGSVMIEASVHPDGDAEEDRGLRGLPSVFFSDLVWSR